MKKSLFAAGLVFLLLLGLVSGSTSPEHETQELNQENALHRLFKRNGYRYGYRRYYSYRRVYPRYYYRYGTYHGYRYHKK